jgi:hypothetical protein
LQEHGRHKDACAEAETKADRKMRARVVCRLELEETMVDDGLELRSLGLEGGTACRRRGLRDARGRRTYLDGATSKEPSWEACWRREEAGGGAEPDRVAKQKDAVLGADGEQAKTLVRRRG